MEATTCASIRPPMNTRCPLALGLMQKFLSYFDHVEAIRDSTGAFEKKDADNPALENSKTHQMRLDRARTTKWRQEFRQAKPRLDVERLRLLLNRSRVS